MKLKKKLSLNDKIKLQIKKAQNVKNKKLTEKAARNSCKLF